MIEAFIGFSVPGFQIVKDVLESVLRFYRDHGASWGWSIVLLTATVRLVMLPLTIKQYRSMAGMQRIQPKVKAIQNKYKGKSDTESRKAMQAEMMALYKEHGVNPFASCLPVLVQMPVFIGLYQVLRHLGGTLRDPSGRSFLGIHDIFQQLNHIGGATMYIMVAVYLASMLGSTLLFSFVQDKQQRYMFAAMSIFFVFFIIQVPAGVGIYWITTNLWTIAQQGLIKQTMGHHFPHLSGGDGKSGKGAPAAGGGKQGSGGARGSRNPPKEPWAAEGRRSRGKRRR